METISAQTDHLTCYRCADNPSTGVPKAPDTPENPRVGSRMKAAGESVGINFTGKCDRSPNTFLSHMLMDFALKTNGTNNDLAELLFKGYFTDGVFPDLEALCDFAAQVKLDPEAARKHMTDPEAQESVQKELDRYRQGTSSVPFFIIDGQPAFSGARGADTIVQMLKSM